MTIIRRQEDAVSEPRFRPCMQRQPMLLPPDLSDLIPEGAMVRLVDSLVERMDRRVLEPLYPGGGAPARDPAMMLKVVLFCYASGIYSSRKIARATRENVNLMWLTGMEPVSHSTVNRFRTERVRPVFEEVFTEVVALLAEAGHITLEAYFLDGTKIEANANRYSFTWRKTVEGSRARLQERVRAHLAAIDEMEGAGEPLAPAEPSGIDSGAVRAAAERINGMIARKGVGERPRDGEGKALRKAAREAERDWAPRLERYERDLADMGERNSLSRTDRDATFMRMKEDHMGNGQLKAAYNVQAGTENQYVVFATVHQRPGDTACMVPHMEAPKEEAGSLPPAVVADAGYGSEENYLYLEDAGSTAYVKHADFFRECRNGRWREDPMRPANWPYDPETDTFGCPGGRRLAFVRTSVRTTGTGYRQLVCTYRCEGGCPGCGRRGECLGSKDPGALRTVTFAPLQASRRKRASRLLRTPEGSRLRRRRPVDVETAFGDIKRNLGFTRFTLRGLEKVSHEWRLVSCGHNIRKMHIAEERRRREGR